MYFPQLASKVIGVLQGGERRLVRRTARRVEHDAAGVSVREGLRKVEVHPFGKRGSYLREVHVRGARRDRVIAALPGPATGPRGFAPDMVTVTPVAKQFRPDRTTRAEKMRLPHLPESMGATVEGRPTADGMAFTMRDGLTSGGFTLKVGPERRLADGSTEVTVTEAGHFSLMRERPKSIWGVPAFLFSHLTPMGWLMQATGGAAVSDAHMGLFELAAVLRRRLTKQGG